MFSLGEGLRAEKGKENLKCDPIQDTERLSNKEPRFLQADSNISHEKRAPDIIFGSVEPFSGHLDTKSMTHKAEQAFFAEALSSLCRDFLSKSDITDGSVSEDLHVVSGTREIPSEDQSATGVPPSSTLLTKSYDVVSPTDHSHLPKVKKKRVLVVTPSNGQDSVRRFRKKKKEKWWTSSYSSSKPQRKKQTNGLERDKGKEKKFHSKSEPFTPGRMLGQRRQGMSIQMEPKPEPPVEGKKKDRTINEDPLDGGPGMDRRISWKRSRKKKISFLGSVAEIAQE